MSGWQTMMCMMRGRRRNVAHARVLSRPRLSAQSQTMCERCAGSGALCRHHCCLPACATHIEMLRAFVLQVPERTLNEGKVKQVGKRVFDRACVICTPSREGWCLHHAAATR